MRKAFGAIAACGLTIGLIVAPSAMGVAAPKQVSGTVSVLVSPNPVPSTATGVTASGNVAASSSCRKDRTVRLQWTNTTTNAVDPVTTTAVTGPNGDYTAVLPKPTDTGPATVTLRATVDQQWRKVGSKKKGKKNKKGRQFNCMELTGQSGPLTVPAPPVPTTT